MALKFPTDEKRNFRKNLVKRHKFVGYLDTFLAKEPTGFSFTYEPKGKDDAWHPSGHCLPPVTELYHVATTEPEASEHGTNTQKNFIVGHFWHQLLQWATLQLELAEPSSIERRAVMHWNGEGRHYRRDSSNSYATLPWHWATGAGDVAPLVLPRHGEYLVDFKTMNDRDFKTEGMPNWCAEKYEAQINIYMSLFDIEKALIVPVQKGTPHEFKEFEFIRNQPLIDAIYDKWEFVSECIDLGYPPNAQDNDIFNLKRHFRGPIAQ